MDKTYLQRLRGSICFLLTFVHVSCDVNCMIGKVVDSKDYEPQTKVFLSLSLTSPVIHYR